MELFLGVFAMMAVMSAILGGTIGVRMMYINSEYLRIIQHMQEKPHQIDAPKDTYIEQLRTNVADNQLGIILDGLCVVGIISLGLVASLGTFDDLSTPVSLAFILFLTSTVLFQYHARNVLVRSIDLISN